MLLPNRLSPATVWRYVPQCFIGLFFMSAAFLKSWEAFFGPHRYPLARIFESWISTRLGVEFYMSFMQWSLPYADALAVIVILCQGIAGLLLVLNYRTRIAGILIFFVQTNVYLAIYHQIELRNLNAEALWAAVLFFALPELDERLWKLMTFALVLLMMSHLYGRFTMFGDPFPRNFSWQFDLFTSLNMSSWPGLKSFVVWVFSGPNAALLWASGWWIKLLLTLGLLTRYRLYAGAALLVYMFALTLTWLSTFACEGAFWVLLLYVWVTQEWWFQKVKGVSPHSYLP